MLEPKINFAINRLELGGKKITAFEIFPTTTYPVKFNHTAYIRMGSATKAIYNHPELERDLWRRLDAVSFEEMIALNKLNKADIINKLNIQKYCESRQIAVDFNKLDSELILEHLIEDKLVVKNRSRYDITNLGAMVLSNNINEFSDQIIERIPRLIFYQTDDRLLPAKEIEINEGYISCIPEIMRVLTNVLPAEERIVDGVLRKTVAAYPLNSLRELIVNALMHQDVYIKGMRPMIEVFQTRIEIRNPGKPLIRCERFVDSSPECRNSGLARMLRILGFYEGRGMGIDLVINECESRRLPAPSFIESNNSVIAIMYSFRELKQMTKDQRIWSTYFHACIKYVERKNVFMTNASLRERFEISDDRYTLASRIIKLTLEAGLIKVKNKDKSVNYIPHWVN